jgi:hypothetical protein
MVSQDQMRHVDFHAKLPLVIASMFQVPSDSGSPLSHDEPLTRLS